MGWVVSALLALMVWTVWFVFGLGPWVPGAATAIIVLANVIRLLWGRIRASRASAALKVSIMRQGAQQAQNARPERRAEIQALQKQVQAGLDALETARLGKGKRGGAAVLHSLPWYVIIGPPGAGKTTALEKSGLVFPFANPRGGGVRGVGGTRNCDWWFTNEAILLDTAGRYTMESDDRDEWLAFLQVLKKHRSHKPINGVLLAISVAELVDADELQLESTGKKLRARIDEVMTQLQMVVPVYLLITKCDLVAGFVELFGDLRRSEREQAWGATIELHADASNPSLLFERELDLLVQRIHARALERCAQERCREARERIYQFPLEFAAIKRNVAELVQTIFAANTYQTTPIFRGFYFTSGTQEGRPLERVLARMGAAMGIRPPETAAQRVADSKSYFLHDVFTNIVFPDRNVAFRSAAAVRRQKTKRIAAGAGAIVWCGLVLASSVRSFAANRDLLRDGRGRIEEAMKIDWHDGRASGLALDRMDRVLEYLKKLEKYRDSGVPFGLAAGMYSGEEILRPSLEAYVALLQQGFVVPCKTKLEAQLAAVSGKDYLRERTNLETYLMMSDVEHLDVEQETGRLTRMWATLLAPTSSMSESQLRARLVEHVRYYLDLVKRGVVRPLPANMPLVEKARDALRAAPVQERIYALLVDSISEERYDEAGDDRPSNRRFPPLGLEEIFADRPEVWKLFARTRSREDGRPRRIEGPYTANGRYRVSVNIKHGIFLLESAQWVVPLGPDELGTRIPEHLRRLAEDYDQRYIYQWNDFLAAVVAPKPSTVKEAVDLYEMLHRSPQPYLGLLRAVEDHTQWTKYREKLVDDKSATELLSEPLLRRFSQMTGGLRPSLHIDVTTLAERPSTVPPAFAGLVAFGVQRDRAGKHVTEAPIEKYTNIVDKLRRLMVDLPASPTAEDMARLGEHLSDAVGDVEKLLATQDDRTKALLRPLLLDPLRIPSLQRRSQGQ